jgi:hypothetical protein
MSPSKDEPPPRSPAPKIAIKGFSLSSKPSSAATITKKALPATLGQRPRPGATFGHDSDSGSEHEAHGRHERVTGFASGEVIRKEERRVEAPLVIPKIKNREWGRKRKNLLPPEVQAEMEAKRKAREGGGGKQEGVDMVNSKDGEIQWGLSVRKRERDAEETAETDANKNGDSADTAQQVEIQEPIKEKTADEKALAALLGEEKERKGPDLVIAPIAQPAADRLTEEDAYRLAVASAPDASTLEDYERVPVEEFGAAMLRGMGWKGETNSSDKARDKGKDVKRRQNLLGLGAKELKDAEELGAWVQKSDVKRLRPAGEGGNRKPERKPGVAEYQRERDEKRYREGGYRESERRDRNKDRDRNGHRHRDDYRDRDRDRDRDHRDRRR